MRLTVYRIVDQGDGRLAYEVDFHGQRRLVRMLSFQHGAPQPEAIECVTRKSPTGFIEIKQDIIPFIRERYQVDGEYEFTVRNDYTRTNRYYELKDDREFYFKLYASDARGACLLVGQKVRCRVKAINEFQMRLALVGSPQDGGRTDEPVLSLDEVSPGYLRRCIEARGEEGDDAAHGTDSLLELLFVNSDSYDTSLSQTILRDIKEMEPLFSRGEIIRRLRSMRSTALYLLEESDCLLNVELSQRRTFQDRLARLVSALDAYALALEAFESGEVCSHLDRLLSNLQKSGYVYRASEEFDFMQRVFNIDHSLIPDYMGRIFSIIHERDRQFWNTEPFRKAFIRLLQLFITDASHRLDLAAGDEDRRVTPLIEALAIQLKLSDRAADADVFDYNLNLAMLYRLASHLRTSDQRTAIGNAYRSLLDMDRGLKDFNWGDTRHHDLLASKISANAIPSDNLGTAKTYEANGVRLVIRDDGMQLAPARAGRAATAEALPTFLCPRTPVSIRLDSSFSLPQKLKSGREEKKDLSVYRTLWSDIETHLFDRERSGTRPRTKRAPMPDDMLLIRVVEKAGPDRWRCVIEEDEIEGEGYMHTSEIVPFNTSPAVEDFWSEEGQLVLEARIINIDAEGLCRFTIKKDAFEHTKENDFHFDAEFRCVLTVPDYQRGGGAWLGISSCGTGVSLMPQDDTVPLQGGDEVIASRWEPGRGLTMQGVVRRVLPASETPLTSEEAVRNLLAGYAYSAYVPETDDVFDEESLFDKRRLVELINIVDRVASMEKDHIQAYNYLAFARVLSRLADDPQRHDFYKGWMKLIAILHHFSVNGRIDTADLREFEDKTDRFDPQSELQRRFLQLKIVSLRGNAESRGALWEYTRSDDETVRALAENVLAYNLVSGDYCENVRSAIDERIYQLLNVHQFNSRLHIMEEDEGPTVEYKTSLVYPSDNHMRADYAMQTGEILKGVCAMLNARGGTIHIGVNNYHAVVGISEDLAYKGFNGDQDRYDNAFRNQLRAAFGNDVDAYVDTLFADYKGKTVYEIRIRPYLTGPVRYQQVVYERHGSSKIALTGDDEAKFIQRRRGEARLAGIEVDPAAPEAASPASGYASATDEALPQSISSGKVFEEDRVSSSVLRPVDRLSREAHPEIVGYIVLLNGHYRLQEDYYGDDSGEVCLALPVLDGDEDKYLVMAYASGSVCRVPLKHILDKKDWTDYIRYHGERLLFAEIMDASDGLLSIGLNRKRQERIRIDRVERICEATNPASKGAPLVQVPLEEYVLFEVVPADDLEDVASVVDIPATDSGRLFRRYDNDNIYGALRRIGLFRDTF